MLMADSETWDAIVDDAIHEINMRWGVRLDDSDEPDTEPMDQVMVRATAEAILAPHRAAILARTPEASRFDAPGCQMCGAPEADPCDCFDPQGDVR